ncbi:MAG: DUF2723 domain-containing protein [Proteobacteria bacterium]|nr:DUF2723 domain-containing protein [Pseudomonadota bacterium]
MRKISIHLSFFIPFIIYLITLCPQVSFFDSGELISSSNSLGISHPPGYTLYILLSHIFKYIPIGSIPFKISLFSAVFGSLCCLVLYLISLEVFKEYEKKELISLASSFAFALSFTHWSQSVVAEVYSLSTFIIATAVLLCFKYKSTMKRQYLYFSCFLVGIGIVAHYTALVLVPVIIYFAYRQERKILFDIRQLSLGIFFILLGLTSLFHLPFRAWQTNALVWGDPQYFTQFLWVILREGYKIPGPERSLSLFFEQMGSFNLYREFGVLTLFFIIFGFIMAIKKLKDFIFVSLIVLIVLNVGVVIYGNPIPENIFLLESFHTPGYLILSVFVGSAIYELSSIFERAKIKRVYTIISFIFIFFISMIYYNFKKNDWSDYYIAYDYAKNVLKSCERNSVLLTWGDSGAFPLWYLQRVEKYRTDVVLVHTPHIDAYWYWNEPDKINLVEKNKLYYMWGAGLNQENALRFLIKDLSATKKVHIDYSTKYSVLIPGMIFIPDGLIYTYVETPRSSKKDIFNYMVIRGFENFYELKDLDTEKAKSIYAYCFFDVGVNLLLAGDSDGKKFIKKAVEIIPELRMSALSMGVTDI